jgi:hypothetical protein
MHVFASSFETLANNLDIRFRESQRGKTCNPPPNLDRIIRACFSASLRTEERRQTVFSVVVIDEEYATRLKRPLIGACDYCTLVQRVPLTADHIRKIAAGLEPLYGAILAWSFEQEPKIWGVARFPIHTSVSALHRERIEHYNAFRITARGPGSLVFDDLDSVIGELHEFRLSGHLAIPTLEKVDRLRILLDLFASEARKAVPLDDRFAKVSDSTESLAWSEIYHFVLREILRAAQSHRRGATFIIAPEDKLRKIADPEAYTLQDVAPDDDADKCGFGTVRSRLTAYYRDFLTYELAQGVGDGSYSSLLPPWALQSAGMFIGTTSSESAHRSLNELRHACEFVGRLSAADGAVLLTPSFNVYAMGAKLNHDVDWSTVHYVPADKAWLLKDEEILGLPRYSQPRGSRFKSGVSCSQNWSDALVIVVSSDGPMSALTSVEKHVLVYEPISISFDDRRSSG